MKATISIRRAYPGDAQALSVVGQATFLETFAGILGGQDILAHCSSAHSEKRYASWLTDSHCSLWLVERSPDAAPIGYGVLAPADLPVRDPSQDDLELKRIYVLSKFQGGGVGTLLMDQIRRAGRDAGARRLLLGVYAHNHDALRFYERFGFVRLGTRQFRVGSRAYDDIILGLDLGSAASKT